MPDVARVDGRQVGSGRALWQVLALVAAGYAVGSLISFLLFEASTAGAVFFPPAGVSLAALVLTRRRWWPWILVTVVLTETVIDLSQGMAWRSFWGFALANSVEPLISALLLRRLVGRLDLSRRRDLGFFLLCGVVIGPFFGGLIGGTTISIGQGVAWLDAFLPFWAGDALGVLTVGGTILTWRAVRSTEQALHPAKVAALSLLIAAVTVVAFWPQTVPLAYLPMPLLLWLAFGYGVAVVAAAGLAMTLTANIMSAAGRGPWAALASTPHAEVATLQLFLAVAILAAWLLAVEIQERERAARMYEREHEAAHQLQRALLPEVPARLLGADIGATYRPADAQHEVGGDWYDAFALPDGRVGLVVGDITGHDLQAAIAMGRMHAALRVLATAPHDGPGQVLEALDEASAHIPGAPFSTVGYAEYDVRAGQLRYACAGHPPPLLVDGEGPRFLPDGRSTPLGVTDDTRPDATVSVHPGAMLLWYSDGLIERRGSDLDTGLDRLARVAATFDTTASPQAWCDAVIESLTGGQHMDDDVVLICLRLPQLVSAEHGVDEEHGVDAEHGDGLETGMRPSS